MEPQQRRLTKQEREEISRGLAEGRTGAAIGRSLGRDASVVNREIARGGGRVAYRAHEAQKGALRRGPGGNKIASNAGLRKRVHELLGKRTAPREIASRLRVEYPGDKTMQASHERIYDYVYCHARPGLRKWLISMLKQQRQRRAPRSRKEKTSRGRLPGAVSIRERPEEVESRKLPGDWESDLIVSASTTCALLVAVERTSRYTLIRKVPDKRAATVGNALCKLMLRIPADLRRTLTYDNGREMADHVAFATATNMRVYFADPHSPWQRGSVEQTNGLIRDYFPKGTDFSDVSHQAIARVQYTLNTRPRGVLASATPAEVFLPLMNAGCAVAA